MPSDRAARQPRESRLPIADVDIALYDWPGDGPPIIFTHGAGFHGRCFDQVIAHLPGRRCIAIDFPAHGHSAKPAAWSWPALGELIVGLARALDLDAPIAAGHSMGGYAVALAAALEPSLFTGLLLVDPVIFPPDRQPSGRGADGALRRRNVFSSPGEMFERFRDRPPFDRWQEQALRDYCQHGLLPSPDGDGYVLACSPELEAEVYRTAVPLGRDLSAVTIPVRILRARTSLPDGSRDMTCSPADPALASRFPNAIDLYHPELTHFIPMEAPALVASELEAFLP